MEVVIGLCIGELCVVFVLDFWQVVLGIDGGLVEDWMFVIEMFYYCCWVGWFGWIQGEYDVGFVGQVLQVVELVVYVYCMVVIVVV